MADLNYEAANFWGQAANYLLTAVVGAYAWLTNRHKANAAAIAALEETHSSDMNALDGRLIKVETELRHLPTHEHIAEVYERLNGVADAVAELNGQLKQINTGLQLIHQHLLSQGAKP